MNETQIPFIPNFWDSFVDTKTGEKLYETREEESPFKLPPEEWDALRFRISNKTLRLAECYNHPQGLSFGIRLHPPHLWDIREGIVYKKVKKQWVRYRPDFDDNAKRVER